MPDEKIVYFNGVMTPASQVALSIYGPGLPVRGRGFRRHAHLWRQDIPAGPAHRPAV